MSYPQKPEPQAMQAEAQQQIGAGTCNTKANSKTEPSSEEHRLRQQLEYRRERLRREINECNQALSELNDPVMQRLLRVFSEAEKG